MRHFLLATLAACVAAAPGALARAARVLADGATARALQPGVAALAMDLPPAGSLGPITGSVTGLTDCAAYKVRGRARRRAGARAARAARCGAGGARGAWQRGRGATCFPRATC
jgi:hypothetical protein